MPILGVLQDAKQHLEAYLDQRRWGAVPQPSVGPGRHDGSTEAPVRMIMTPSEVNK